MGAEFGGGFDRVFARRHGIDASVKGMLRPRPDLDARLLVELAVALDKAGLQRVDDHRRRLVEALPRLVHAEAERSELTPGQATSQTEAKPALAQHVAHGRLLGH